MDPNCPMRRDRRRCSAARRSSSESVTWVLITVKFGGNGSSVVAVDLIFMDCALQLKLLNRRYSRLLFPLLEIKIGMYKISRFPLLVWTECSKISNTLISK